MEAILVEYAAEKALDQRLNGCHFTLENPANSAAWRLVGENFENWSNDELIPLCSHRPMPLWLEGAGGGLHYEHPDL